MPYVHMLLWLQKAKQEHNAKCLECQSAGRDYLGETPYSLFVIEKANTFRREIGALLDEDALTNNAYFGKVWQLLPADDAVHRQQALTLIVSGVLRGAAGWHYRVSNQTRGPMLYLLSLLMVPHDTVDETRMEYTQLFLDIPECCLRCDPLTDVFWKLRATFRPLFERTARTGRVDKPLWNALVLWRSKLCSDTQHVEGFISVLQRLTRDARRMDQALANARLSIKLGYAIDANEAAAMDTDVAKHVDSGVDANRFAPVISAPRRIPKIRPCEHVWSPPPLSSTSFVHVYLGLTFLISDIDFKMDRCVFGPSAKVRNIGTCFVLSPFSKIV